VKLLRNKSHGEIERKELNAKSWSWWWLKERQRWCVQILDTLKEFMLCT